MKELLSTRRHIEGLANSPSSRIAIATSALTGDIWDGEIIVMEKGKSRDGLLSLATKTGNNSVVWLTDNVVATGDDNGDVLLWRIPAESASSTEDAPLIKPYVQYREHESAVSCVSLADGGRRIASASLDGTCRVWAAGVANSSERLLVHVPLDPWCSTQVFGLTWCSEQNPSYLATTAADGVVRLWDLRAAAPQVSCSLSFGSPLNCIVATEDERVQLIGSQAGELIEFDWRRSDESLSCERVHAKGVRAMARSATTSPRLALGFDDGAALVLAGKSLESETSLHGHADCVSAVAWTGADGNEVVTGGVEKNLCLHELS